MTSLRRLLIGAAALVAGTMNAGATTITNQIVNATSGTFTSLTAGAGGTAASETLTVAKFNAATVLASVQSACATGHTCSNVVLTAIALSMTPTITNTLNVSNGNSSSKTISAGWAVIADLTIDLQGSTGVGLAYDETVPTLNGTANFNVGAKTGGVNGTASRSATETLGSTVTGLPTGTTWSQGTGAGAVGITSPYALTTTEFYLAGQTAVTTNNRNLGSTLFNSDFIGSGSSTFVLGLQSYLTPAPNTPNLVSVTAQSVLAASGNLKIQYTYSYDDVTNSAPEPGTMALFGTALVGIGLLRRRSRS